MHSSANARLKARRIAFLVMDRLDLDALRYALSACERLDACLDILTNLPSAETDRVVAGARGTADTSWRIIRIGGECGNHVFRYAQNEPDLLFFVSSAGDEKVCGFRSETGPNGALPGIPWVIVERRQIHPPTE